jgi:FKBP-type peptidyl-prolyl cis-trans isomerase FkpA
MRIRTGLVLAVVAAISVGCALPTGPSANVPFSVTDLVVGTGNSADSGESITVDYTGWLYDPAAADHKGLVFDTSIGKSAFTFDLGTGTVIAGWDQGLLGMKVGGTRELVVPPSLAYGDIRSGIIPANATLLFDVTLNDAP